MRALSLTIPKRIGILSILIVLYFITSSADMLSIRLFIFTAKASHIISLCLFIFFFTQYRVHIDRKLAIAGIFIFLSMMISSFFSPYYLRTFGYLVVYLAEFFLYFILPYNLLYQLNEKRIFKMYLISFWIVGLHATLQVLFSFAGIYIPHVGQFIYGIARPGAFTYEPSYYALYMTAFAAFWNSMYLFSHSFSKKMIRRNVLFGNFLLLISTSTGVTFGYMFFIFSAGIFYFFIRKRIYILAFYRKIRTIFVSFLSFFFVVYLVFQDFMNAYFFKFFYAGLTHYSFDTRWKGIKFAWETFLDYPFFGVGNGGVGPYVYMKLLHLRDISKVEFEKLEGLDPTNVFTEVLASQGLLGFLCFSFLIYVFIDAFRKIIHLPDEYQVEKEVASALFLSLITLVLVLQFNQGLFRNYIWIHSAITIAYLHKLCDRSKLETISENASSKDPAFSSYR